MASVEPNRRGRGYTVRWRDEQGRQRKRTVLRKIDADRLRSEVEHQLHTGAYVDPAAGRVRFRDYAEAWRQAQVHRPNTAGRVASQLNRHVYPKLGGRPLAAVRPSDVQALAAQLSLNLAPGSVRSVMSTVGAIFAAAVRDRAIGHDPTDGVKLPELPRKRVVPLTVEQVNALADAMPAAYRALVVTAAGTGVRQGEAFGLQVRDVDFLRRVVHVERQVQPHGVGPLKNRASHRSIPVGQVVIDALADHLRQWPASGETFIFRTPDGRPPTRNTFNSVVWRPARERAGLPAVGFHDLRHFHASALIRAGLSVKAVSERLGHGNAAMTLGTYAHLWPDDEDRSRQAIDDLFQAKINPGVPTARPAAGGGSTEPQVTRLARPPPSFEQGTISAVS